MCRRLGFVVDRGEGMDARSGGAPSGADRAALSLSLTYDSLPLSEFSGGEVQGGAVKHPKAG